MRKMQKRVPGLQRQMIEQDLPKVQAILKENDVAPNMRLETYLQRQLSFRCMVTVWTPAEGEDEVIAFIIVEKLNSTICEFAVKRSWQQRGVGRELIEKSCCAGNN